MRELRSSRTSPAASLLRPGAVDLLDRAFHGLGRTGFPLSQNCRIGPELIEGSFPRTLRALRE